MTRANARELAVHLIYAREFTGEEPESIIAARLEKEYYGNLSQENQVYEERPSRAQRAYIDNVVLGVANRVEELNDTIGKYGDGASGAKTLIGAIERMNEKCWSDGEYATAWYNDNQNDLNDVHSKLKSINESLETLDLIENIN